MRLFARANPVIKVDSCMPPPVCLMILTLVGSALPSDNTVCPACKESAARCFSIPLSNLPASDVSIADSICSVLASIANSSSEDRANFSASAYPLAIIVGCTPCLTNCQAFLNISAQITTVVVVPSLATLS